MDTVTNAEVYNMVIWGGQLGGTDGIDVWGSNVWIHDVQVSNRDECVTTKVSSLLKLNRLSYKTNPYFTF